ncbi:L-aspartate oxidase [Candidatus Sumerlaeota bacterium]|nr:L-aspartate oxidase [Candidatus Sumerlaeota bacterium]
MPYNVKTDVLVIGCGIAGAIAALTAADQGARVLVVTGMGDLMEGNTAYAQGGIIYKSPHDSPELLTKDIIRAGAGRCHVPAVELLAEKGPALVKKLLIDKYAIPFDQDEKGRLDFTTEGAHSLSRVIHVADWTGKAIIRSLVSALKTHPGIRILKNTTAVDILTLSHHSRNPGDIYREPMCVGIYALNQKKGWVFPIFAKETILATGGLGQIYLHTTNPRVARGDGIALAYRAGVRLINLEYVQFHPTTLFQEDEKRFLITESLRGEGGILIRRNGERFMDDIHPMGSLAPRDIVARAIQDVMLAHNEPCVYLDVRHLNPDWARVRFPNVYNNCAEYGIDITKKPIPVVPAAHYSCGGIAVDLMGRASLKRLWAVGEVSCTGVHGANRLASASLLEGLVWGYEAGRQSSLNIRRKNDYYFPSIEKWIHEKETVDPALIYQDWLTIKYTMWNYVGLTRTSKRLERALHILRELQQEVERFYKRGALSDGLIGLRNGVQTAMAVLFAAQQNRETRGCHFRVD